MCLHMYACIYVYILYIYICIYAYVYICNTYIIYTYNAYIFREGNGTPLQYFCLKSPMDGGAWWAAVHGVARVGREFTFTFTFHFHALEKEMATHSSVLAWRIPGQGSLVGCRLWGRTESDTTERRSSSSIYIVCVFIYIRI